jgi:hypothetical protein
VNDNPIRIGETPIFDQLARELGYERLVTCGPANPTQIFKSFRSDLGVGISGEETTHREPKIALRFLGFVPLEEPKITGKIGPEQFMAQFLEEASGTSDQYVMDLVKQFREKYPDVVPEVTTKTEVDGTTSVAITPAKEKPVEWPIPSTWISESATDYYSNGGEDFDRERVEYFSDSIADEDLVRRKRKPEGEIFPIRGISSLPPYFRTEPKTHHVPEDLTGRQLELYKALMAPVVPVDPIEPEQTDESVNAAPKDKNKSLGRITEGFKTKPTPRPLWISDEEITYEE